MPVLLTAAEVADRFKVTRKWVYRHAAVLGGVRLGGRALRFTEDGLARYLDAQRRGAGLAGHTQPASATATSASTTPRTYRVSLSRRTAPSGKASSSRVIAPASDSRITLA
jgi:hypothetical protein